MKLSHVGKELLKSLEGLRLEPYLDSAGVPTIGYGHTGAAAKQNAPITPNVAEDLLDEDLKRFERCVSESLTRSAKQYQFDAFVILAFNIGCANFKSSTLLKRFNLGQSDDDVVEAWRWWNKITVNGAKVVSVGLVNRRNAEISLFLSGCEASTAS